MGVTESIDRDTAGEVEIAVAGGRDEPAPLPALEYNILSGVGAHHGRRRTGAASGGLG